MTISFRPSVLLAALAHAQDAYPSKSVRLIAAAAPGGNPDVLARMLAAKLADAFGRPFVVENLPGAGGVVAAEQVARAAADGHTLMLGDSGALAINVALNPKLTYQPLQGFHADHRARRGADGAGGAPVACRQFTAGLHQYRKSEAARLRLGRQRLGASPHHGGVPRARPTRACCTSPTRAAARWSPRCSPARCSRAGRGSRTSRRTSARASCACCASAPRSARRRCPTCRPAAELGFAGFDIATVIGLQAPAGLPRDIVGAPAGGGGEGAARARPRRAHGQPRHGAARERHRALRALRPRGHGALRRRGEDRRDQGD